MIAIDQETVYEFLTSLVTQNDENSFLASGRLDNNLIYLRQESYMLTLRSGRKIYLRFKVKNVELEQGDMILLMVEDVTAYFELE